MAGVQATDYADLRPRITRITRISGHGLHGLHGSQATDFTDRADLGHTDYPDLRPRITRITRISGHGLRGLHGFQATDYADYADLKPRITRISRISSHISARQSGDELLPAGPKRAQTGLEGWAGGFLPGVQAPVGAAAGGLAAVGSGAALGAQFGVQPLGKLTEFFGRPAQMGVLFLKLSKLSPAFLVVNHRRAPRCRSSQPVPDTGTTDPSTRNIFWPK